MDRTDARIQPRVTLAHDWLTGMRGGEKCLEALCRHWPSAPLYTLLHKRGSVSSAIERRPVHTSFLQCLPAIERNYRYLLPLMPAAVEAWRLPACELVVSFSHCVAKAVHAPPGVPHVCYCFTPMRYIWHQREAYFGPPRLGKFAAGMADRLFAVLRYWDRQTAGRVSHFVAISQTVQQRIAECYGRASTVIYPPVDTDFFSPSAVQREEFYLVVSAFAPYKRLDLAIATCNRLRRPLVIIGSGQDAGRLRALAGPTVQFLGWQPDTVVRDHFRRCRALLFPGEEDFGIVPLEAQACGAPVIAYGHGGATETVIPWGSRQEPTGLWFEEHRVDSLAASLEAFESHLDEWDPAAARRQALRFNHRRFEEELFGYLDQILCPANTAARRAA
ncbi:MAG TPA: glycosyltransferase [Gemmataceae bacterium]|nr:glycosyltransferase [Gemmataceae bacterium]